MLKIVLILIIVLNVINSAPPPASTPPPTHTPLPTYSKCQIVFIANSEVRPPPAIPPVPIPGVPTPTPAPLFVDFQIDAFTEEHKDKIASVTNAKDAHDSCLTATPKDDIIKYLPISPLTLAKYLSNPKFGRGDYLNKLLGKDFYGTITLGVDFAYKSATEKSRAFKGLGTSDIIDCLITKDSGKTFHCEPVV